MIGDKKMSKLNNSEESSNKPISKQALTPGQLKFGDYKQYTKKLGIKQYFTVQESEVFCLRFCPEEELIAAGCNDGVVRIYNLQTNKLQCSVNSFHKDEQTPATAVRWRPTTHCPTKQVLVTANSDGSIMHWHAQTGKPLHKLQESNQSILCMDYNKDGSLFATAGNDFHVRVYDEDSKTVKIDFKPADWNQPGHSNRVFGLKFVDDNPNILLSSGWDTNMHVWDLREKESVAAFYGPSVSGDAIDYCNGTIVTGSYRNKEQIQLWDLGTRKLIQDVQWEQGYKTDQAYVYSVQFCKNGNSRDIIAGCAGLNELKIFNEKQQYKPCASIIEQREGVYCVDYGKSYDKFAFGGGEGIIYIIQQNE